LEVSEDSLPQLENNEAVISLSIISQTHLLMKGAGLETPTMGFIIVAAGQIQNVMDRSRKSVFAASTCSVGEGEASVLDANLSPVDNMATGLCQWASGLVNLGTSFGRETRSALGMLSKITKLLSSPRTTGDIQVPIYHLPVEAVGWDACQENGLSIPVWPTLTDLFDIAADEKGAKYLIEVRMEERRKGCDRSCCLLLLAIEIMYYTTGDKI